VFAYEWLLDRVNAEKVFGLTKNGFGRLMLIRFPN